MTRTEYGERQREITKLAAQAQADAARRIRALTLAYVGASAQALARGEQPAFAKAALATDIAAIIRAAATPPLARLHDTQTELETALAAWLGLPPRATRMNAVVPPAPPPPGRQSFTPEARQGKLWSVGATTQRGAVTYRRDPVTGKIIWDQTPLEMLFQKRADLSTQVWRALEEMEARIFDVIRGGRALGRDARAIGQDLEVFIRYRDGGARVLGRWGAMFPNTAAGRRAAWEREYLAAHGQVQVGSADARALLQTEDAWNWLEYKRLTQTGRKPLALPAAVKDYAARLGKAGLDYRVIRVMRTESAALLTDEQTRIARESPVMSGRVRWVLSAGREHWGQCGCEELARGGKDKDGVYEVGELERRPPVHPNCDCQLRPLILTDAEIDAKVRALLADGDVAGRQAAPDFETGAAPPDADGQARAGAPAGARAGAPPSAEVQRRSEVVERVFGIPGGASIPTWTARKNTNTNFAKIPRDDKYTKNCPECALAYEMQRRGYPVTAAPAPADRSKAQVKNGMDGFKDLRIERPTGETKEAMRADLKSSILKHPVGARFIVVQQPEEGKVGHTYIAERQNGAITFIDPQNGTYGADYLNDVGQTKEDEWLIHIARIDNADLKDGLEVTEIMRVYDEAMFTRRNERDILSVRSAAMTKEEAFEVLKADEEIRPHYAPKYGVTYAVKPGKFYEECINSFGFVGYPYTVEPLSPPDPDRAYEYFVDKEDGRVSNADVPLGAEEAAAYWLEDAAETREEAYEVLKRSALIRPHDDPATGQTYAVKPGKFYRDYGDAFGFVGYPYTVGSVSHPAPEHAYVYRVDKATAYVSVGERLGAEEAPAYWLKDAVETREHAYEVLKASEMIRPRDNLIIRETSAIRPGKFYRDYGDAFGFVGYPYKVEPFRAPAPEHAFVYLVYKASGHVIATGERLAKTEAPAYWLEDAEAYP